MSHFSLNLPSSDTLWYTPTSMDQQQQQQQQQSYHTHQKSLPFFNYHSSLSLSSSHDVESDNSSSNNNNNNNNTTTITTNVVDRSETTSSTSSFDREYMFEKPLTPSDVGKLNRLVIPKQHAEKYFPLANSNTTSDASATVVGGDKSGGGGGGGGGVLLGFEDESGKCWKFRYSYWNSSQSYVLTKGWSRYVKEKKLDAGDVVLFDRHRFESDRFFIGWRRRGSPPVHNPGPPAPVQFNHNNNNNNHQNYGVVQSQGFNGGPHHHQIASFPSYRPDCLHAGTEVRQKGRKSGGGNSKRVRLFGVNLECQIEEEEEDIEEPQTSDGSSLSSQGQGQVGSGSGFGVNPVAYNYFDYVGYPPNNNYNNHMDMNFPQDVNQMRNRLR